MLQKTQLVSFTYYIKHRRIITAIEDKFSEITMF
jgi:hypothetical protein